MYVVVCLEDGGVEVSVYGPFDDLDQAIEWNNKPEVHCPFEHVLRPVRGAEIQLVSEA